MQTQVLPYLRELVAGEIEVFLLTFEPRPAQRWKPEELESARKSLADEGIRLTTCRLIFDIRGLMAEEYADAGVWTENSAPFRAVKRLERAGIRKADQLVVLTGRMRDWLVERKLKSAEAVEVIPCCVDFARFDERAAIETPATTARAKRFEVVYAGSVTGLYLLEEMGRFFLEIGARREGAFLRIMTQSSSGEARARLLGVGLKADDFWVGAVKPEDVPAYLKAARLGLSFRKRTFSQIAASPTKVPEYLAAGLPVVCNAGIGDTDDLLHDEQVGVVVESLSDEGLALAAGKALALAGEPSIQTRCIEAARKHFDLNKVGGTRYRNVYRRLEEQEGTSGAISKISLKAR